MRLIEAYREQHGQGWYPGTTVLPHAELIGKLIRRTRSRTVLDYGCGQGLQYRKDKIHKPWRVSVALYDPAVERWSVKPQGRFDGLVCSDVLEHVPEDELPAVFADFDAYARLWCFVTVCCRPAKKSFPDGANVHVTIRSCAWWRRRLMAALPGRELVLFETL